MEISKGGVAVDNHDSGFTTEIAERLVGGAGDNTTAEAAHKAETGASGGGGGVRFVPGLTASGARGGIDGVRVATERCARGHRIHGDRPSKIREER